MRMNRKLVLVHSIVLSNFSAAVLFLSNSTLILLEVTCLITFDYVSYAGNLI